MRKHYPTQAAHKILQQPVEKLKSPSPLKKRIALLPAPISARIAIIIDDFGYNLSLAKPFLQASFPVGISILPKLPYSERIAEEAKAAGKTVLLHLPIEAAENNHLLGPGALFVSMDPQTVHQTIESDLATVPGAEGINNHMGSRGSADPALADEIAATAKSHNLFLVDSLTAPDSLLYEKAKQHGVPAGKREIFLDNRVETKAIETEIEELARMAREKGTAIAIGHPHWETLLQLYEMIPKLERQGIQIVPVQELIK